MLRIGELSKRSGLTKRTIDYYTNLGLLEVTHIEENRYRQYDENSLHRINLIEFYKTKHLTLDEIKRRLETIYCIEDVHIRSEMEHIWSKFEEAETAISELKTRIDKGDEFQHIVETLSRLKQANLQSMMCLFEIL